MSRHPLPTHFHHVTMTKRVAMPHFPCHGNKKGIYHLPHLPKKWVAMLVHTANAACHVTTFTINLLPFCRPSLGQTQTVHQPLWSPHLSQCLPLIRHPSLVCYIPHLYAEPKPSINPLPINDHNTSLPHPYRHPASMPITGFLKTEMGSTSSPSLLFPLPPLLKVTPASNSTPPSFPTLAD